MSADPSPRARLARAFALAPLAAPVTCFLALLGDALVRATFGSASFPSPRSALDILLAVAIVGTPLAYGAALVAGAPVYVLLRRAGMATRWTLWLSAAVIGAVVALLVEPHLRGDLISLPFPWWVGALLGVVTAETFWWLLGRPARAADAPGVVTNA